MRLNLIAWTEARATPPVGTIHPDQAVKRKATQLDSESLKKYLSMGHIPVFRTEGFSSDLGKSGARGIFYFIGGEGDEKLPLGSCLVALNKVDAAHQLGFSRKFILAKLNYKVDVPQERRSREAEDRLLLPFLYGTKSFGGNYDQFDVPIASAAKAQHFDTIIILKEPTSKGRTTSELIDLRSETMPVPVANIEADYFSHD